MTETIPSYSGSRALISVGIGGTAVIIFGTLIICASLFRDINSLYDEIHADLDEFKDIANDAWRNMMNARRGEQFTSIFRQQRQAGYGGEAPVSGGSQAAGGGSQCNCAARAQNCPAGPPGPPGKKELEYSDNNIL